MDNAIPFTCPQCGKESIITGLMAVLPTPRTDLENDLADEEFRIEYRLARKKINLEFYEAGIKEVVEWIEANKGYYPDDDSFNVLLYAWQFKLKEWGL